jgi:hypothetical protein
MMARAEAPPVVRRWLPLIVVLSCMLGTLAGAALVTANRDSSGVISTPARPTPTVTRAPSDPLPTPPAPGEARTVLVLFVDPTLGERQLQGVWEISMTSGQDVFVKGLTYDLWVDFPDGAPGRLSDAYRRFGPDGAPVADAVLTAAVGQTLHSPVDDTLVIDERALAALLAELPAVDLGDLAPGETPLALMRATDDSLVTIDRQYWLLAELIRALRAVNTAQLSARWHPVLSASGRGDLTRNELATLLARLARIPDPVDRRFALLNTESVERFFPDGQPATRLKGSP